MPQFTNITRSKDVISGEVLHVDDFGNIITNIPGTNLAGFRGSMVQVDMTSKDRS